MFARYLNELQWLNLKAEYQDNSPRNEHVLLVRQSANLQTTHPPPVSSPGPAVAQRSPGRAIESCVTPCACGGSVFHPIIHYLMESSAQFNYSWCKGSLKASISFYSLADVYPYLRRLCRTLGLNFGTVDMRWGVKEETAMQHDTVNVCLGEISRWVDFQEGRTYICIFVISQTFTVEDMDPFILHS